MVAGLLRDFGTRVKILSVRLQYAIDFRDRCLHKTELAMVLIDVILTLFESRVDMLLIKFNDASLIAAVGWSMLQ